MASKAIYSDPIDIGVDTHTTFTHHRISYKYTHRDNTLDSNQRLEVYFLKKKNYLKN